MSSEAVAAQEGAADQDAGPVDPIPAVRGRDPRRFEALRAALPGWIAGHVVVCLVSWYLFRGHPLHGLFVWDTHWYRAIAINGYGQSGGLLHFFPLTPAIAGVLSLLTRLPATFALFGVVWLADLLYGVSLYRLTLLETGDKAVARRSAWLIQLVPGGYALVMGLTEPLAGLLAVLYVLALRTASAGRSGALQRFGVWPTVVIGLLAGLSRPTGVLLAVFGAFEGWRICRAAGWRPATTAKTALAALAPALGMFAYLLYSRIKYHDWMLAYTQQMIKGNRGALLTNPMVPLRFFFASWHNRDALEVGTMCVILVVGTALLICVVARKLPVSYLAWIVPSYVLAVTPHGFESLPRYIGALFPVVMVLAMLTAKRRSLRYPVYALSVGLLAWTTYITMSLWLVA